MTGQMQLYREGGRGWAVVFATFLAYFIGYGTMKALGVLIISVKDDFDTDLWIIGSITSVYFSAQLLLVPLAAAVSRKVGLRCVIMLGGALYGMALILASLTDHIVVFAVLFAVMAASGAACVLETSRAAIALYFHERYSLAIFVAVSGDPIGMMVYGPVTQLLLETYGWRGTMLLLGAFGCHFIACGLLVKVPANVFAKVTTEDNFLMTGAVNSPVNSLGDEQQTTRKSKCRYITSFLSKLGLEFLVDPEFALITCSLTLMNISFAGIVVYMVPNGLSLGLSSREASFLTVAWGVGNIIGYGLTSFVLRRGLLPPHTLAAVMGTLCVTCLVTNNFVSSFVGQMLIVGATGVGPCSIYMVNAVLMRNMPVGDDQLINLFCWKASLCGLGTSIFAFVTGWLYEVTGSFQASFAWCGVMSVLSVVCVFVHHYYTTHLECEDTRRKAS